MKLMSFAVGDKQTYGVATDDGVIDMGPRIGDTLPKIKAVLDGWALDTVAEAAAGASADYGFDEVEFRPVVPRPGKIVCVGLNYEDHRIETGREPSGYPALFPRYADSQVGHNRPMILPRNSDKFDYEGELAVIMGKTSRHISRDHALAHVAGYACYNDGSIRDWQRHTHQFLPGKNFEATGAFGPWMVTTDEIPDPGNLTLTTRLNGEQMQHANTDQLIFNVPYLISYISSFMPLRPGDVIVTGTPGGVGFKRTPPVYMKDGDVVEVEISGIGTLRNPIKREED
jgi:2-keto-4-pentenoate hydratase/2-oxohepta-3-ene-1,7-dioic acid hydratase in catechol pathway